MSIASLTIKPVRFDCHKLAIGPGSTWVVDINSPTSPRKAVYKIARMFRREFGYDVVQYGYEGREDDADHQAFIWDDSRIGEHKTCHSFAVGACCFRYRRWKEQTGWALQWAWLHPYYRNTGLLKGSWSGFRERFGDFNIEHPYSPGMWFFMRKHAPWMFDRIPDHYIARHFPTVAPPAPPVG